MSDSVTGVPEGLETKAGYIALRASDGELVTVDFDRLGVASISVEALTKLSQKAGYIYEGTKYE